MIVILYIDEVTDHSLSKHCRLFFKTLGAAAMLSLFLWQASAAVDKYRSGLTSLQERLQDSGRIHYPRGVQNSHGRAK